MYGINRVVGDFRESNPGEEVAWAIQRTIIEARQIYNMLNSYMKNSQHWACVEFGSGYGRLARVMSNYFQTYIGLERDPELFDLACRSALTPRVAFKNVESLAHSGLSEDASLSMSWTVLQHMPDYDAYKVAQEMTRVLRPGGHVLIAEEEESCGDHVHTPGYACFGRTPSQYSTIFGMKIVGSAPRFVENGRRSGNIVLLQKG